MNKLIGDIITDRFPQITDRVTPDLICTCRQFEIISVAQRYIVFGSVVINDLVIVQVRIINLVRIKDDVESGIRRLYD